MTEYIVTSANFEYEILKSSIPVVADFWAEWCGPCKMIAPILKDLAVKYDGKIKVAKIDVDNESDLAQQFNVMSIPTVLIFKGGKVTKKQVGAALRSTFEKMFEEVLSES